MNKPLQTLKLHVNRPPLSTVHVPICQGSKEKKKKKIFDLITSLYCNPSPSHCSMAFKPNRLFLNANFEGYKLSSEKLPTVCRDFAGRVDTVKLTDERQRSYQHVKALTMRNQLTVDPWESKSVYWRTEDGLIMKGTLQVCREVSIMQILVLFVFTIHV